MSNADVVYLSDVRLSFPNLAEPQVQKNEKTGKERISYGADLIMTEQHPGWAQFMQVYQRIANDKWKQHAPQVMQMIHSDRKSRCYGYGSEKIDKKTFQPYVGYAGNVFITASSKIAPQMFMLDGSQVNPNDTMAYKALAMKMYGGCYVNAAVRPWPQENEHGRGIRCDIIGVQFCKDGEPFGEARPDVTGMFGQVAGAPAGGFGGAPVPPMPGAPFGAPGGQMMPPVPQFGAPAAQPMPAPPQFGQPGLPTFLGG